MRVGILGGGQLGWMTILEGKKLGFEFLVLEENTRAPACKVADGCFTKERLEEFFRLCDVITYEFEHVDEEVLNFVSPKLLPSIDVLKIKRSKVQEKLFLERLGYPVPRFTHCTLKDLKNKLEEFGLPAVVKSESFGYDGKGLYRVYTLEDIQSIIQNHKPDEVFLVEELIDFDFEISIVGARDKEGNILTYTPTYNYNHSGILLYNYTLEEDVKQAEEIFMQLAEDLRYVGILAIEFFYVKGKVLINEIAPRVHNTGHYTLDGSYTSQFENHVRAICGLPLGSTKLKAPSGMVNLLGLSLEDIPIHELLSIEGTKLYYYGKEKRPRRKMGHVNVVSEDYQSLKEKVQKVLQTIYTGIIFGYGRLQGYAQPT